MKKTNVPVVTLAIFMTTFMTAIEGTIVSTAMPRSEERRVGKEWRSRWSRYHKKKKKNRLHTTVTQVDDDATY